MLNKWEIITKRTLVLMSGLCYNLVKGVLGIKIKEVKNV